MDSILNLPFCPRLCLPKENLLHRCVLWSAWRSRNPILAYMMATLTSKEERAVPPAQGGCPACRHALGMPVGS